MPEIHKPRSSGSISEFRKIAREALQSGDNSAIRKPANSDVCIPGKRSFKERLIEWFPNASRLLGISLSHDEKTANISASNEFISALSDRVGEEKATQALGETYTHLSKGLPLTARHVAYVLDAANLGKKGVEQNIKNQTSFQSWYQNTFDSTIGKTHLRQLWTHIDSDAHSRDLTTEDFARLIMRTISEDLNKLQAMPGSIFNASDEEEYADSLKALKHDEAILTKSMQKLPKLVAAIQEDNSIADDLKIQAEEQLKQVKAKYTQVIADLHPREEDIVALDNVSFSKELIEGLTLDYAEDALSEHPRDTYLDQQGETTTNKDQMLIRAKGFGNDIGRCAITLNGQNISNQKDKGTIISTLLESFTEKYGAEKGPDYLKKLSNTLGQALFAGVLTRNIPGGTGPTEAMILVSRQNKDRATVAYDITLEDNGIRITAHYEDKVQAIITNPGTQESITVTANPSQSYVTINMDLRFLPEAENAFIIDESGCNYSHTVVPLTHASDNK
ncbi:MAG TPA: hypothetical protein DIU37_00645 [Opitutae bacterium]|nr:hypothetical protein [Opitutae bacterium]|tara:strand:+ start:269 stop:1783 length:1515 start_codon:yes stop_codon:yes gene_type:complete